MDKTPGGHFCPKRIDQKNISMKFQFLAKIMGIPPGGQTVPKRIWHVANSEMLTGIKNMFGSFGYFFRLWNVQAKQWAVNKFEIYFSNTSLANQNRCLMYLAWFWLLINYFCCFQQTSAPTPIMCFPPWTTRIVVSLLLR